MTWPDSSPVAWGPSSRTAAARSPPAAHPYSIRFRDALGKRREESGYGTQDDAIERLTQLYAVKKTTAPSVAAARRELGQLTVEEYAKQWRPRQQRMTDYSTGWHVDSSINVHIVPRMGARKLNSVTPMVVERFLDEMEGDGVGRGNQANMFWVLKTVLRDAFAKGGHGGRPGEGSPGTGLRAGNGRHSLSRLRDEGTDRGR
ncbi:hypothetical protein ABZ484_14370 [Streptomyces sp. NPDC006393]|uniref:hypothetical protein n=1 Tax=Streptomyces sp. NPDC006393 TaxID=3156763 RepID=UPI003409FFEE